MSRAELPKRRKLDGRLRSPAMKHNVAASTARQFKSILTTRRRRPQIPSSSPIDCAISHAGQERLTNTVSIAAALSLSSPKICGSASFN